MNPTSHRISRRNFLRLAGLTGVAAGSVGSTLRAAPAPVIANRPRNLIFMVADGMSQGTLAATHHWLNLTADRDSQWMQLYRDGIAHRALMETRSASSVVTDSAAAASSWGGGERILNRQINISTTGEALTPLYAYGKRAGKALGLVTTARITHATPAGFAANQLDRDDEDLIAPQYLERGVDVLLGGGERHFSPESRKDGVDLAAKYAAAGYRVVATAEDLRRAAGAPRLLGTFSRSHLPYVIDRAHDARWAGVPDLETMAVAAIESLRQGPNGFLLQIEAGRVDHAAHDNDPGAILGEMLEFDRCLGTVRRLAQEMGDTLVIVTTDHGTGGFNLNGEGIEYVDSTAAFLGLDQPRASFEAIWEKYRGQPRETTEALRILGLPDEERFHETVAAALAIGEGKSKVFGRALRDTLAPHYAVSWTTLNHTAEMAEFAAFGPGRDAFAGFFENWEVHHRLRELLTI